VPILWHSIEYFFDAFDIPKQWLCHTRFPSPQDGVGFEL
jgi:hypothetical protein